MLSSSIQFIKSVGPKRAEYFENVGIKTIKDLLFFFPTKYLDRTNLLTSNKAYKLIENGFDGDVTVIGKVISKEKKFFSGKDILIVNLKDEDGFFECIWFQGAKYYVDRFNEGDVFAISTKPAISRYGNLQFAHPDFDKIANDESQFFYSTGKIIPFYRIPKELKSKNIGDLSFRKMIAYAIENHLSEVEETLSQSLLEKNNLLRLDEAIKNLHFAESFKAISDAKKRFKYEELFYLEVLVQLRKKKYKQKQQGISFKIKTNLVKDFVSSLPYELTSSQKKVLHEIRIDMEDEKPMNRLLQGDVGSGKTIVAIISMLIAVDNDYQAVLMAPTEILADQHVKLISMLMKSFHEKFNYKKINVSVVIGGQKKSEREKQLEQIEMQQADIIVGTHALFEEKVVFKNLGLVVIDEQHRFGVAQRAKLLNKGKTPDVIVMSATPIPRTLTMTLYGDLDISTIDEMPKNRIPIKTFLRGENKLPDIYKFIVDKSKENYQTYIVYPLVEESDKLELKSAESYYEELSKTFLKDINVGLIHGRMKWQEKEEIMFMFSQKKFDVLISTTVIEVGIDIPDANIILINDAHRFGLSQLHQLRGRVGRSNKQAYCILVTKNEYVASSIKIKDKIEFLSSIQLEKYKSSVRLQTMVKHLDGFKVAEVDLKLRGPGNIFGIQQSGFPNFNYADLTTDVEILLNAKKDADEILKQDAHLLANENKIIRKNLLEHYSDNLKYAKIG